MPPCQICGDSASKRFHCKVNLIFGTEYDLFECLHCGLIFFDPMPTESELTTFYSASYYDFDKSREEGKGMAFARSLMRWKPRGKFLDVGCATGFFINGIRKHSDWDVYGTDFGASAVRFARDQLGLNVVQGDLVEAAFQEAFFDYIHVNNVLEHVPNPISLLRECRKIIKPDGIFFLSVPNGFNDSLDLINFWKEENKPARSKNGHIFFFPARTLLMLFDQIGFEVKTKKTYSIKRGLRSVGHLPRKSDWKKDYYPRESPEKTMDAEVTIPDQKKKHSDFYYKYRFVLGNLQMIPGLHRFGLDYLFILRPK